MKKSRRRRLMWRGRDAVAAAVMPFVVVNMMTIITMTTLVMMSRADRRCRF